MKKIKKLVTDVAYLYEAFFNFITCVTMHLLKYVVKVNSFYSSDSKSNGRAIVVVIGPTAVVYICQSVFDLHFANLYRIEINLNPD